MAIEISDADIDNIRLAEQGADAAIPAAGFWRVYAKADGLYYIDDAGNVIGPLGVPYTEGARAYNSGDINTASGAEVTLTFDSERYDTDAIHDLGVNPSRLTCKTAGKYQIIGNVKWESNIVEFRYLIIKLNAATPIGFELQRASQSIDVLNVSTQYELAVGNFVELIAYQNSGGNLDVVNTGNYSPEFMMQRIG